MSFSSLAMLPTSALRHINRGGRPHAARADYALVDSASLALACVRQRRRIGLVLGAGGLTGMAYHAGTLLALQRLTGWDPRSAHVIVGTSAGSVTGSLFRRGVTGEDLYAFASGDHDQISHFGQMFLESAFAQVDFAVPRLPTLRMPSVLEAAGLVKLAWGGSPALFMLGFLGSGRYDMMPMVRSLGDEWPREKLLVPAVRRADGARIVFDGADGTDLHRAVAASCSVPGLMQDVHVAGSRFVDGGVSSASNLDLLSTYELDAVVVVSPMTGDRAGSIPGVLAQRRARTKLGSEMTTVRGIPTLVLQPRGPLSSEIVDDALWSGDLASISARALGETEERIALLSDAA